VTQHGTCQEWVWGVPRRGITGGATAHKIEKEGQRSGGGLAMPDKPSTLFLQEEKTRQQGEGKSEPEEGSHLRVGPTAKPGPVPPSLYTGELDPSCGGGACAISLPMIYQVLQPFSDHVASLLPGSEGSWNHSVVLVYSLVQFYTHNECSVSIIHKDFNSDCCSIAKLCPAL